MSVKVVQIAAKQHDKAGLLEVVDKLRAEIEAGKIVGFGGVGISPDDDSFMFKGSVKGFGVTRLKMLGAMTNLLLGYYEDCEP